MKLKLIKDSEMVVSKVEYELLKQEHSRFEDLLHSINFGSVSYYIEGFYPLVKMTNKEVSLPIKRFASNDHEYNRICAEELVELLNQKTMNENLNLVEILKDCPKGTVLYSTIYGDVILVEVQNSGRFPIKYMKRGGTCNSVTAQGLFSLEEGECILFPSKDQRDWSKFTAPWYKKERFDPKTLKPFDKVLTRRGSESYNTWFPDFISAPPNDIDDGILCMCNRDDVTMVIPYNEDTKHLICTNKEAPEYYRYWED